MHTPGGPEGSAVQHSYARGEKDYNLLQKVTPP
jgi:hypothetical protein